MPEQIALIEAALIDASDRKSLSMVHDIGEGEVLGRPAKFRLTVQAHQIEVWVDRRVYTISLRELLEQALLAIEGDMRAKVKARALAVHGSPAETDATRVARALFGGVEAGQ
ncbi:hypothetical protein ROE7235_03741 [Roseibaca ekhonensis]|uniref:Uncharacterized protein n=1 Tax=Roseinatronobacter ekhonensis TaxID=254356 RepID=A0A3B0MEV8_9RHOB|nr:hypothetical protein [Roseibaca ekhonensis]SUZ33960.1 hypothetical protein ROE7235_03741 [Roseibaca ekhonensis]